MSRFSGLLGLLALSACTKPLPKHDWHVLTGLPLFFSQGSVTDVLEGKSIAAPIITALSKERSLQPLDTAEAVKLAGVSHLLAIQPSALPPAELVALDDWVRKGGKAVILADPDLVWPHDYPLGDKRTPPPSTLLDPLFAHWGLVLEGQRADPQPVRLTQAGRTVLAINPGKWVVKRQGACVSEPPLIVRCALGKGLVLLVADADLADGRNWHESGTNNQAFIESLLEELEVAGGSVENKN